jgi:hypothetical protein
MAFKVTIGTMTTSKDKSLADLFGHLRQSLDFRRLVEAFLRYVGTYKDESADSPVVRQALSRLGEVPPHWRALHPRSDVCRDSSRGSYSPREGASFLRSLGVVACKYRLDTPPGDGGHRFGGRALLSRKWRPIDLVLCPASSVRFSDRSKRLPEDAGSPASRAEARSHPASIVAGVFAEGEWAAGERRRRAVAERRRQVSRRPPRIDSGLAGLKDMGSRVSRP